MTFTKKLITKIWSVSLIVEWKLALMLWVSMLWLLNLCTLQFKCFVEKKCRFQTLIFVNEEMKPIWLMCLISHLLNLDINNMDQKTHWFQLNGNYSFNLIKFFFFIWRTINFVKGYEQVPLNSYFKWFLYHSFAVAKCC